MRDKGARIVDLQEANLMHHTTLKHHLNDLVIIHHYLTLGDCNVGDMSRCYFLSARGKRVVKKIYPAATFEREVHQNNELQSLEEASKRCDDIKTALEIALKATDALSENIQELKRYFNKK